MKKIISAVVLGVSVLAGAAEIVACWGDSVTEGMAMPRDKAYPARLQARLGDEYKVLNSGSGGENSITIPVRQGGYKLATAAKVSFKPGEDRVLVGDGNDNGFRTPDGSKIKLTSALGREIPVNDVLIGKDAFKLCFSEFRWNTATNPIMYKLWLTRRDSAKALEIAAGTPVKFASVDISEKAACEIIFMGANGGWNNDIKVLIGNYRAMLERRGANRPYLVIVPYWGGFPKKYAEEFKAAFGRNAVDFCEEAIRRGLAYEGLKPTELDKREMAAGRVPPSLLYRNRPDVHMNEYGYDFLAQLLFERGKELGYWKGKRADFAEMGPAEYRPLRRELRAFHPDECHQKCKSAEVLASHEKMRQEVREWAKAHPDYDALDVRREYYRSLERNFVPVMFENSPFYFEAGVNGGWIEHNNPARIVDQLCNKFYKEKGLIPQAAFERMWERYRQRYSLCCGPFVDNMHHLPPFRTIFKKGFKGVREEVAAALAKCPADDPLGKKELETALVGLDVIRALQLKFAEKAKLMGKAETAAAAMRCPWEPPRTFFEGLNTIWFMREILGLVDGVDNFSIGHPDAWLIDFYHREIAAGTLTEEKARDLVRKFMIHAECHQDGLIPVNAYSDHEAEIPLTIGGCDKDGKPFCNELTMMFLDEHLAMDLVFPKMHVRFSRNSPKEYLEKIASQVLAGHAVFAMFNDDVAIPVFEKMGYPVEAARDYICTGCWDGNVDSYTDVDGANYMSVIRVIEETIYQDKVAMAKAGVKLDPIDGCATYEEVEKILIGNFLRFFRDTCCEYTRYGRANAQIFPHPAYSMCLEGGIKNRRDTTDGGTAFHPRVMTLAFLANAVDSMCAIRKVVFEDRFCTLGEFLAAVRANWKGERAQAIRNEVMKAPYWGDNSAASNALMKKWIDTVADDLDGLKNDQGSPFVLACWIYREFMYWGGMTRATPDGRYDGDRLAQGFAPSEYRNKSGVADVFHALASLDHSRLYASNANLMFGGEGLDAEKFAAIFRVFARTNAHLLQPNCCDVETLLDAQKHPERYQHLMIKVCGFSARFVALSKRWQDEIIARHRLH